MRLAPDIALVGSGSFGFDLSSAADAHLYLIDGGDELALVDAGAGGVIGDTGRILANIAADGFSIDRVSTLLLTHYHFDHMGGAAEVNEALGIPVHASPLTARVLEAGDEAAISLPAVKAAGFVPDDYHLRSCLAVGDLVEGTTVSVGHLTVRVFETPGHCAGHVSLLVEGGAVPYLVEGDVVFAGGTILLQNVPDCSIQQYAASVAKLAKLPFEAFLPGHGPISLQNGRRHIEAAARQFEQLGVPSNFGAG